MNRLFRPTSSASRIFVDNAGTIMEQFSSNSTTIKNVSEQYGVDVKSLQDSVRYCLFRWGPRIEKMRRRLKHRLKYDQIIAEELEAYLCSRKGRYTNIKMMVDYLKTKFTGTIVKKEDQRLAENTINRARVAKILKDELKYTWSKNYIRDPRADNSKLVEMRKVFP